MGWDYIVFLVIGFVLSLIASILGALFYARATLYRQRRPLNQILNFGNDELLFVFPHREDTVAAILPRTSTEDFLAINNVISVLLQIGWNKRVGVRDTKRLRDSEKKRNLVSICSRKSNPFTGELQGIMRKKYPRFFRVEPLNQNEWYVTDGKGEWKSNSYSQLAEFLHRGGDRADIPEQHFDDVAVINKITNPWNSSNKILVIEGARGIGTWGAAECIKKGWEQIFRQLPDGKKDSDFSALVFIRYYNCDITQIIVDKCIVLEVDGK